MSKPLPRSAADKGGEARTADGLALGLMARRIGFRMRLLQNLLGARVVAAFAPFGLRPGTFTTMALIAANPGLSQIRLAREGGLDKSALVAIVDQLEERGLAVRTRSVIDRRSNSLALTPAGEALMQEMSAAAQATEQCIRDGLSPAEVETLFELLERAYQIVAREDAREPPG
ncbi:MarR family winged helix-turn-helix transcriptional regulator [Roseomonas sp. BN140053]|uniref:MarR family winged helix-turn-helix transcriptional regulator n=1 Tax=Roseomonas sp. BN140053 TaxID=3391898 RepID=UPI0039ED2AAC